MAWCPRVAAMKIRRNRRTRNWRRVVLKRAGIRVWFSQRTNHGFFLCFSDVYLLTSVLVGYAIEVASLKMIQSLGRDVWDKPQA